MMARGSMRTAFIGQCVLTVALLHAPASILAQKLPPINPATLPVSASKPPDPAGRAVEPVLSTASRIAPSNLPELPPALPAARNSPTAEDLSQASKAPAVIARSHPVACEALADPERQRCELLRSAVSACANVSDSLEFRLCVGQRSLLPASSSCQAGRTVSERATCEGLESLAAACSKEAGEALSRCVQGFHASYKPSPAPAPQVPLRMPPAR